LYVLLAAAVSLRAAALPSDCTPLPNSNTGCEFYALTLPSVFVDQATFSFGVDLLNTSGASVDVTINGGGLVTPLMFAVPAASTVIQQLPWVSGISMSTATSKIIGGAYHITSTDALSALQLSPTDYMSGGAYAYSGDASLLIPPLSAGVAYRLVSWPTWNGGGTQYPGYVAVVATVAGTTVQVAAQGTLEPGAGLNANGGSVVLGQGDVLLVSSALDAVPDGYGSDLSGTLITSSAPVLVWTGHVGTFIPAGTGYADHLEEILPPV